MSFPVNTTQRSERQEQRVGIGENMKRTVLVVIEASPATLDSLGGDAGRWSLTPEVRIFL